MSADVYTFRTFIKDEIQKRGFSDREFARKVGISSGTIATWLNEDHIAKPELAQLIKVSDFTKVSLATIIGLAYPDVAARTSISPSAMALAEAFEALPEELQNAIRALIRGSSHRFGM